MGIKKEYENLKQNQDITLKLERYLEDPNFRGGFKLNVPDDIYKTLAGDRTDAAQTLILLYESKAKKLKSSDPDKEILKLMAKAVKRKLSLPDLYQKTAIGSAEQLLLSAYLAPRNAKQLLLNKAKALLALPVAIREQQSQMLEHLIFGLDQSTQPKPQLDAEISKLIIEKISSIENQQPDQQREQYRSLSAKIEGIIKGSDLLTIEEMDTLLHYKKIMQRKLGGSHE